MNKTGAFFLGLAASSLVIAAFVPPPAPPVGNTLKPAVVGVVNGINGIAESVITEANHK